MNFYRIPDNLSQELDIFEKDLKDFVDGKLDPVAFRAIRVAHGMYEERKMRTCMIRIRTAAGGITPRQLRKVAQLAKEYANGDVRITTRQAVQLHEVFFDDVIKVLRGLQEVGLSSRGGGGNTIRQILTSVDSGISPNEVFDVDPYAMELTSRMIAEPDSFNLPRKIKTVFSNSDTDSSFAEISCIGFVATIRDGQQGFKVYCGGGMGNRSFVGQQLMEFIPENRVYQVMKALKIMFDQHGNRRNRHTNRMRFLWQKLGKETFSTYFLAEYNKIAEDDSLNLVLEPLVNQAAEVALEVANPQDSNFELWKKRFVKSQKQAGLSYVMVTLKQGDLWHEDAYRLCDFVEQFTENSIRCDRRQNIVLRNIPNKYLPNLYNLLSEMRVPAHKPFLVGNMLSCTGAKACKAGICLTRGLSDVIEDVLDESQLDLDRIQDFKLHFSGCPNSCSLHHLGDLGFAGRVKRHDSNLYPAYSVYGGAATGELGKAQFAKKLGEIPAHYVPNFIKDVLNDYVAQKEVGRYRDYFINGGETALLNILNNYQNFPKFQDNAAFFTDWGAEAPLTLDYIGKEECSSGMFDMIHVDAKHVKELTQQLDGERRKENKLEPLYKLLYFASRMLLVTRGLDGREDWEVFQLFQSHFIAKNLIDPKFSEIVKLGEIGNKDDLLSHQDKIIEFGQAITSLYNNMDDSLRFHVEEDTAQQPKVESVADVEKVTHKDLRGVTCPMNFVKTKLVLDTLDSGDLLEVLLDGGEPVDNVPSSVELEGHTIVAKKQVDDHWSILVKKK